MKLGEEVMVVVRNQYNKVVLANAANKYEQAALEYLVMKELFASGMPNGTICMECGEVLPAGANCYCKEVNLTE